MRGPAGAATSLRLVARLLLAVPLAACSSSQAKEAAIGTATMVGVVAVHRSITGDCWARCSPGYFCDRESGLCVQGECRPACDVGYHCALASTGHTCAPDAFTVPTVQPPTVQPPTVQPPTVQPSTVQPPTVQPSPPPPASPAPL